MKQAIFILLLISFATCAVAQAPAQMFWALNKNQLLLDQVKSTNASMAYSVRKLKATYTGPAMRVRRGSFLTGFFTGATADVAFNIITGVVDANSIVTITSALSSSGVSVGTKMLFSAFYATTTFIYVTTWYDQSGNARHVTQATEDRQPRIMSSGLMESSNGQTSVLFIRSRSTILQVNASASDVLTAGFVGSASAVSEASSGNSSAFGYGNGTNRWQLHLDESGFIKFDVGNSYQRLTSTSANSPNEGALRNYFFIAKTGSPSMQLFVSGINAGSSTATLNACTETEFNIGGIPSFGYYHNNHQSEVIIFPKALNTNEREIVHLNQRLFYKTP